MSKGPKQLTIWREPKKREPPKKDTVRDKAGRVVFRDEIGAIQLAACEAAKNQRFEILLRMGRLIAVAGMEERKYGPYQYAWQRLFDELMAEFREEVEEWVNDTSPPSGEKNTANTGASSRGSRGSQKSGKTQGKRKSS